MGRKESNQTNKQTKWSQVLNELNITPRVLEITSGNFRKYKNLNVTCNTVGTEIG